MSNDVDLHHGFKRISAENWQEPNVTKFFPHLTPEIWIRPFLLPQLDPNVPKIVVSLFEVARGSMIYGWCFYPLLTLAAEQLYRVKETAVRMRCSSAGIPTRVPVKKNKSKMRDTKFDENTKALVKAGFIAVGDTVLWDATRQLRNLASHPDYQSILDPGTAKRGLKTSAAMINRPYS